MIIGRTLLVMSACCACTREPTAPAAVEQLELVGVQDDARDQYALLHDVEAALGDGLTRDGGAMAAVQRDWHGRRYRWEAAMVPLFCTAAARCFVAPFDHTRSPEHRIRQGWMPRLELDEAGFTALQQACAGKTACVVRFAGTMGRFVFDVEQPTAVEFSDVEIIEARAARPDESWLASTARARS